MSFSPGQFITATRLNRLQPTTYWGQCSGAVTGAGVAADIAGTSISIPVATNGATASMWWSCSFYAGATTTTMGSVFAQWDVNAAPTFAVFLNTNQHRCSPSANWTTTITTAGTYTFKLRGSIQTGQTLQIYTTFMVQITEVV